MTNAYVQFTMVCLAKIDAEMHPFIADKSILTQLSEKRKKNLQFPVIIHDYLVHVVQGPEHVQQ